MFEKLFVPIAVIVILILTVSGIASFMGINPLDLPIPSHYRNSNWKSIDELDNVEIKEVKNLEVSGGIQVNLEKTEVAYLSPLQVENEIRYQVQDDTLLVGFRPKSRIKFTFNDLSDNIINVGLSDIEKISVMGSGTVNSDQLNVDNLRTEISGSGSINLTQAELRTLQSDITGSGKVNADGASDIVEIDISGSGQFNGQNLVGTQNNIDITGSGQVRTNSEELNIDITGSGSVEYRGRPEINQEVTGSGRVYRYQGE